MGCCGCSSRATSIFAAIYSLIQASAWIGIAIFGLEVFNCNVAVNYETLDFNLDQTTAVIADFLTRTIGITYFYNPDCNFPRPTINVSQYVTVPPDGNIADNTLKWDPLIQSPTQRTYSFMLAYTILSALWIASSIVLLIIAVGNKKSKAIAALHYPWILTMAALIVLDVVATVMYCLDIQKTTGLENILRFMGLMGWDDLFIKPDLSTNNDIVTAIPSIVMAVIFSRFLIFWIFNFVLFVYVFASAVEIGKQKPGTQTGWKKIENPTASQTSGSDNQRPWHLPTQELTTQQAQPYQPQPSYPMSEQQNRYNAMPTHSNYTQHPEPQRAPMESFTPQQPPASQYALPNATPEPDYYNRPTSSHVNPAFRYDEEFPTYRPEPKKPKPLPKPQESSRFAGVDYPGHQLSYHQPSAPGLQRNDSKSAPTELRSQLPWSYFQSRDDPINVRHQQIHEYDEDLPPIPVPDYTLHFPRRPR